jgi:hypothetical protein
MYMVLPKLEASSLFKNILVLVVCTLGERNEPELF